MEVQARIRRHHDNDWTK